MHAWQMTPEEFHGASAGLPGQPSLWNMGFGEAAAIMADYPRGAELPAHDAGPDYTILPVNGLGDFIALDADKMPVGALIDANVAVDPKHARRGLGLSLVRAAWEERPWPPNHPHQLSTDGAKLLSALHRNLVREAVLDGRPVPAAIEARYAYSWAEVFADRFARSEASLWDNMFEWFVPLIWSAAGVGTILFIDGDSLFQAISTMLSLAIAMGFYVRTEFKSSRSYPRSFRRKYLVFGGVLYLLPLVATALAVLYVHLH